MDGKPVFNAITVGGSLEAYAEGGYNDHTIQQFLVPFSQTVKLCNMAYLPSFVIRGIHLLKDEDIEKQIQQYKNILTVIPDALFNRSGIEAYFVMANAQIHFWPERNAGRLNNCVDRSNCLVF